MDNFDEPAMEPVVAEDVRSEQDEVEPPKEFEIKLAPVRIKEKRNSKDEKSRKKDERSVEQILKNLSDLDPEKKLNGMVKKYMEVLDENRKLQALLKLSEKKIVMVQREKDQIESERSKAVLIRSRLESLCRELQRQNKAVKEESLLKIREEEEKRKEVSAKFQTTLTEITALMTETNEKNVKLHEDNMNMHKKFQSVFDEMDIREQHFEEMHQMMKQELQATETKLAKVSLDMAEEKETMLKEKNTLLLKLTEYQNRIRELQAVEAGLRTQVNMYTEKYTEFQNALTKSNEVFGGFHQEMEKMSKKILKLEKETHMWKTRWEKTHNALLDMATEKQAKDAEFVTLNKRFTVIQELCKTFQLERTTLLAQLKEKTKAEDNQNHVKNVKITENSIVNGLALSNEVNDKVEEETKEQKTEEIIFPIAEVKVNECSRECQESHESNVKVELIANKKDEENISAEVVNSEVEKCLAENELAKDVETQQAPAITNSDNIIKENSAECDNKKQILQVPAEIKDLTQNETALVSEQSNVQDSVISDAKDVPTTDRVSTDTATSNGEINSHPVSNKKHKDGKKKRK